MSTRAHGDGGRPAGLAHRHPVLVLTAGGAAAFWAGTVAGSMLPIAAEYRSAFSITHVRNLLVEAPVAGLIVAFSVALVFLRGFDRIPGRSPVIKALVVSMGAFVVTGLAIRGAGLLLEPSHPDLWWFAVGAALDVPRFVLLGIVVGLAFDRIDVRGR